MARRLSVVILISVLHLASTCVGAGVSILDKLLGELDKEPEKARRLARRLAADIASEEH